MSDDDAAKGESIRDRLRSPASSDEANSGGDSRGSELSGSDFQNTDSRQQLAATGHGEGQRVASGAAPAPRSTKLLDERAARSAERKVAALFLLSVIGVVGFFVVYWFADFTYRVDKHWALYTPLLGVSMFLALFGIGAGTVQWAKTIMVDEETVQERHHLASEPDVRAEAASMLKTGLEETGLPRRALLRNTLLLGGGSLALLPVPLLFSLGPYAHKEDALRRTGWGKNVRLVRSNGTGVKLGDLLVGGAESVFPGVPGGKKMADSAVLLIRMRPEELQVQDSRKSWVVDGHVAYSVICTHLGCPVKLDEQQTHHLFCPCHQSTFQADKGAHPIFGPAARPLPQLAISVDPEGYFVAQADFDQPVGPSFWERKP